MDNTKQNNSTEAPASSTIKRCIDCNKTIFKLSTRCRGCSPKIRIKLYPMCKRPKTGHAVSCNFCKKEFYAAGWQLKDGKGKYCNKKCLANQQKIDYKAEGSPTWKGDKVGYGGLHERIRIIKGRPYFCSLNLSHKAKRYQWANISGLYLKNADDFISLCPSCHKNFDLKYPPQRKQIYG